MIAPGTIQPIQSFDPDQVSDLGSDAAAACGLLIKADDKLPTWVGSTKACLTSQELARLDRINHQPSATLFRLGRCVVRSVLARVLECSPSAVSITLTADGKPVLPVPSGWHFNISHTGEWLGVVFSRQPIGIDLEQLQHGRDLHALVRRFFADEEQSQYFALPDDMKPLGFTRGWTCKEALLKAVGSGVRDLQNCVVDLDPRHPPAVLHAVPNTGAWTLHLEGYLQTHGFLLAIAQPA
jgi:4'-phosphopantetheinyl transferase